VTMPLSRTGHHPAKPFPEAAAEAYLRLGGEVWQKVISSYKRARFLAWSSGALLLILALSSGALLLFDELALATSRYLVRWGWHVVLWAVALGAVLVLCLGLALRWCRRLATSRTIKYFLFLDCEYQVIAFDSTSALVFDCASLPADPIQLPRPPWHDLEGAISTVLESARRLCEPESNKLTSRLGEEAALLKRAVALRHSIASVPKDPLPARLLRATDPVVSLLSLGRSDSWGRDYRLHASSGVTRVALEAIAAALLTTRNSSDETETRFKSLNDKLDKALAFAEDSLAVSVRPECGETCRSRRGNDPGPQPSGLVNQVAQPIVHRLSGLFEKSIAAIDDEYMETMRSLERKRAEQMTGIEEKETALRHELREAAVKADVSRRKLERLLEEGNGQGIPAQGNSKLVRRIESTRGDIEILRVREVTLRSLLNDLGSQESEIDCVYKEEVSHALSRMERQKARLLSPVTEVQKEFEELASTLDQPHAGAVRLQDAVPGLTALRIQDALVKHRRRGLEEFIGAAGAELKALHSAFLVALEAVEESRIPTANLPVEPGGTSVAYFVLGYREDGDSKVRWLALPAARGNPAEPWKTVSQPGPAEASFSVAERLETGEVRLPEEVHVLDVRRGDTFHEAFEKQSKLLQEEGGITSVTASLLRANFGFSTQE